MNQPNQSLVYQTFTQKMCSPNLKTNGEKPRPSTSQSRKSTLKFPVINNVSNDPNNFQKRSIIVKQFPMKSNESSKENFFNHENQQLADEMQFFSKTPERPILKETLENLKGRRNYLNSDISRPQTSFPSKKNDVLFDQDKNCQIEIRDRPFSVKTKKSSTENGFYRQPLLDEEKKNTQTPISQKGLEIVEEETNPFLVKKIKQLENEIEVVTKKLKQSNFTNGLQQVKIKNIITTMEEFKIKNEEYAIQNKQYKTKNEEYKTKNEELQAENENIKIPNQKLISENNEFKSIIKNLENSVFQKTEDFKRQEDIIQTQQSRIKNLANKLKTTQRQIKTLCLLYDEMENEKKPNKHKRKFHEFIEKIKSENEEQKEEIDQENEIGQIGNIN